MRRSRCRLSVLAFILAGIPSAGFAQGKPVSLQDSFSIGDDDGILCQVQDRSIESRAKSSMFDRSWAIVCRDSARPVGYVYSSRSTQDSLRERIQNQRSEAISCPDISSPSGLTEFRHSQCSYASEPVAYSVYQGRQNGTSYVAEGLSAYDSATLIALKSVINDNIAKGRIDIATTSIEDPFAFARVQAATLKPGQALAEGYRRNLSGDFAAAAAFFETLQQRTSGMQGENINPEEYLINRALQKSNMGEFAEADELFLEAENLKTGNPLTERLQRNFETIHLLNQRRYDQAIVRINVPIKVPALDQDALTENLEITAQVSNRLNGSLESRSLLGFVDDLKLTDEERSEIIDAQALQLLGTAQRINGDRVAARKSLVTAYNQAIAVRDGRVTSITRLRAQTLAELALISEADGELDEAEQLLRDGLELIALQYPQTRAVNGAKARLAGFLLRRNEKAEALELFGEVIDSSLGKRSATSGMANQLAPYFELLANDQASVGQFFKASQILIRPGVAETQAVLSRELSAGSDDAARLFRQSINLDRNIARQRIRFSALGKLEQSTSVQNQRDDLATAIEELERSQQLTQVRLSEFSQYRAISDNFISLADLQAKLKPTEAYARMSIVGGEIFMIYADQNDALTFPVNINEDTLDRQVDLIRSTISTFENGQYITYPFDIEAARALYLSLFGPVASRLTSKTHLIFEPDGGMLRLPINLLVEDDQSVAEYLERIEQPDGDAFDFVGVNWLGKSLDVSTAVSARAFVDARDTPASNATKQYLGMGQNNPAFANASISEIRGSGEGLEESCQWSLSEWNNPIADDELLLAQSIIGDSKTQILTGQAFSDDQIMSKNDIGEYRILHFATHGLVTAPKPSCPAKPALLTSFGTKNSDGLLSFDEIFDLKLDADIIILSACDTAGKAGIEATRQAGVSSGGGTALDGLVRSFVAAGGRSVLASHWPAPDDFRATEKLIGGLFSGGRNLSIGQSLRNSQIELMDDPLTSHPFYWSGFAIIGDGARELLPDNDQANVAAANIATTETVLK